MFPGRLSQTEILASSIHPRSSRRVTITALPSRLKPDNLGSAPLPLVESDEAALSLPQNRSIPLDSRIARVHMYTLAHDSRVKPRAGRFDRLVRTASLFYALANVNGRKSEDGRVSTVSLSARVVALLGRAAGPSSTRRRSGSRGPPHRASPTATRIRATYQVSRSHSREIIAIGRAIRPVDTRSPSQTLDRARRWCSRPRRRSGLQLQRVRTAPTRRALSGRGGPRIAATPGVQSASRRKSHFGSFAQYRRRRCYRHPRASE